jgi:hypothetical protein
MDLRLNNEPKVLNSARGKIKRRQLSVSKAFPSIKLFSIADLPDSSLY